LFASAPGSCGLWGGASLFSFPDILFLQPIEGMKRQKAPAVEKKFCGGGKEIEVVSR